MEFLTPKQKRDKSRRLLLGYGLFGILIMLATYIMVSTALGYEVFSTKGEVVQNGLLFIDSKPDNAQITINGVRESANTNAKLSLPEGKYDILLQKSGYRDWKRTISLAGGSVEFLTYPRLLPISPVELTSTAYSGNEVQVLQSRDKRWVLLHSPAEPGLLRLHDLDRPSADILTLMLPGSSENVSYEITEWAGDSVHFMVSANSEMGTQLYILNREKPSEIIDVSGLFGLSGSLKAVFWDNKWDEVAVLDPAGIVRLVRIKDRAIAAVPLVPEQVIDFYPLSSRRAVYTAVGSDGGTAVRMLDDEETHQIISLPKSDEKLVIRGGGFNRNDYLVITGGGMEKTLLYRNVADSIKQSATGRVTPFVTMPLDGETVEFSRTNRFLMAATPKETAVYDIEQKELLRYPNPRENAAQIGWFDDSRIYATTDDGTLYIYDYSADNVYEFAKSTILIPYVNQPVENVGLLLGGSGTHTFKTIDIVSESK